MIGTYTLTEIDGRRGPWPSAWPPGPADTVLIIAQTIVLRADTTAAVTEIESHGSTGANVVRQRSGIWSLDAGRRVLRLTTYIPQVTFKDNFSVQQRGRRIVYDVGRTIPQFPGRVWVYERTTP